MLKKLFHAPHQIPAWRLPNHREVIGHQAIGIYAPIGLGARLDQGVQKPAPALAIPENVLALASPIHHVINRYRILDA